MKVVQQISYLIPAMPLHLRRYYDLPILTLFFWENFYEYCYYFSVCTAYHEILFCSVAISKSSSSSSNATSSVFTVLPVLDVFKSVVDVFAFFCTGSCASLLCKQPMLLSCVCVCVCIYIYIYICIYIYIYIYMYISFVCIRVEIYIFSFVFIYIYYGRADDIIQFLL